MPDTPDSFLKPEEKEFQRYYRLSSWLIANRDRLRRLGYGLFIAADALLVGFAAWTMADGFLLGGAFEREALVASLQSGQDDLAAYTQGHRAKPLEPGPPSVFSLGKDRYDFYASVTNPNPDWYAELTYVFRWGSEEEIAQSTFILPGEEKPLVALAVRTDPAPRSPRLEIASVVWHRIDPAVTGDYSVWSEDRLRFVIEDIRHENEIPLDGGTIAQTNFRVKNQTAYSYYEPAFYIRLMQGSAVVGITRVSVEALDAGEDRTVSVSWFQDVPRVTRADIVPEINIFDPSVYKPLERGSSLDARILK